jgi:Domain of unknown function (DUF4037)
VVSTLECIPEAFHFIDTLPGGTIRAAVSQTDRSNTAAGVAFEIAAAFGALPQVEAVASAGSRTSGMGDHASDLNLYVYLCGEVPVARRAEIANARAVWAEVDNHSWELGDEWVEAGSGLGVDIVFRRTDWIQDQLEKVLRRHEASLGGSTCLWYNVRTSHALHDPGGWLAALQRFADQPYPEPLRRAIVSKNHPVLRRNLSSYTHQIERAAARGDRVSVNHRVAAFLASYFDILFALNRQPHPGEKRLLAFARERCEKKPEGMEAGIGALLDQVGADGKQAAELCRFLVDSLDRLLKEDGLLPER